jgi:predicted nucleotidyltransferase
MEIKLPPDFKDFLRFLQTRGVEYLVIGGYAVAYHGYLRPTHDLDIWIAIHPDNAERMVTVLQDFGFNVPELSTSLFLRENSIVRMGETPLRIDISNKISGVNFDECYAKRIIEKIDDFEVHFINLDDLKANKKASAREKDLIDLKNLP